MRSSGDGKATMLQILLIRAQLWKKRDHVAADIAPLVGSFEKGGGNDTADAPALCAALEKASP